MNSIAAPFHITPIECHSEIKPMILAEIDNMNAPSVGTYTAETLITACDYNIPGSVPRKYWFYCSGVINNKMLEFAKSLGCERHVIHNYWFQQYRKNSRHVWHTHQDCHWTSVYFVEFPEDAPRTEYIEPLGNGEVKTFDVKEGDLLTFPSFLVHRAPKVASDIRKTIISFNSSLIYQQDIY